MNGSGVATVTLGPGGSHEGWEVLSIAVLLTPSTSVGEARVYLGPSVSDASFLEGTYDGARDTSPQSPPLVLDPGESITVQWTGATPAARATVNVRYRRVQ